MRLKLGADLGGTTIKLGLVDERFRIIRRTAFPTPDDFDQAVREIARCAGSLLRDVGFSMTDLPFIGLGVPGTVNPVTGRLALVNNTGWENAPMKEALREQTGLPVMIANDADCALAAEALAGSAKNERNVLILTLGTGVGGAMLINGRLFSGCDGMGMEVGHMPLAAGGRPCTCGADGCIEAMVSATGLIALTREAAEKAPLSLLSAHIRQHGGQIDGRTAFDCLPQGDEAARQVVDQYCLWLSQAIGGLINVFRPGLVLLGGGLSGAGELLFSRVNRLLPHFILGYDAISGPAVIRASMGNDAGIIGAACLDLVTRED